MSSAIEKFTLGSEILCAITSSLAVPLISNPVGVVANAVNEKF